MTEPRLMLLDTASLYFRAFHGLPDTLRAPDGRPVNAVRGLLDFIARLVSEYRPTHLACCWDDAWRPQWRVDLLDSYKTHRVVAPAAMVADGAVPVGVAAEEAPDELNLQVPLIREVLAALGLPVVGAPDHEADDVIGSLAVQVSRTGAAAVDVVTGDRDLFQLVDDEHRVRVIYVGRGIAKAQLADRAWVRQTYDVEASAYVDFAVLRGDPSDGIPGVSGIGVKTAAKLLAEHGSLAGILQAASRADGGVSAGVRSKLHAAIDYLAVAEDVVRVVTDLDVPPLEALRLPGAAVQAGRFAELTEELGLGSSAQRVLAALATD